MPPVTGDPAATIVVLRWPEESARRDQLAASGVPRLLLVSAGASPPSAWALDEDWVHETAPAFERSHRADTLQRRLGRPLPPPRRTAPRVALDDDGIVTRDGRWVALSEIEGRLVAVLLDGQGRCVSRARLLAAGRPGEARGARAVDGAVRRARGKLAALDVYIHGITGAGYLLEVRAAPVL